VSNLKKVIPIILLLAATVLLPGVTRSEYVLNTMITLFLYVIVSESWNLVGGFAGQISLGHSAFFGIGALVTRLVWLSDVPVVPALLAGGMGAVVLGCAIGIPCLRMTQAYFPIGTLALAMIAQITIGNIFPLPGSLPSEYVAAYNLPHRYYMALAVAIFTILGVYFISRSRKGLAMVAIRDDEGAAAAVGVKPLRHKVLALLFSSFMAGLGGGIFAYHQVSYFYHAPFELSWAFLPTLTTFIGGLGTISGPVIGSVVFLALSELFVIHLGEIHLLVFGVSFVLIVMFLPKGLFSLSIRMRIFLRDLAFRFFRRGEAGKP
jgi:branched-chain amino acid transport system permease protein